MGAYNEELVKAGVMLAGEGLLASSKGARVRFDADGSTTVIDGPFAETKELVAGFWILEVSSREEVVEWVKKAPVPRAARSRSGRSPRAEDFGDAMTPELREQEDRLRATSRRSASRMSLTCARTASTTAPRRRRGLADGVGQADRRAHPRHRRRRPRRGARPGRAGRGAGAVAGGGRARTSRAPGSWPPPSTARSTPSAARSTLERKTAELGRELESGGRGARPDWTAALDEVVEDDLLRLVFISCHPVLSREARVALTLRLLGGLTTDEIARAFLVAGADRGAADRAGQADPRRRPGAVRGADRRRSSPPGSSSVLEVIYLVFNEGYSATAGERLDAPGAVPGGAAAGPHPGRADAAGVRGARPGRADGDPGSPARARGSARRRAGAARRPGPRPLGPRADPPRASPRSTAPSGPAAPLGPYALQAAIAACHARAALGRGHRLGADRRALRGAGRAGAVPGGRAQPRRRGLAGVRAGRRAGARRRARPRCPRCAATTCCRACAATCSSSSAGSPRRAREFERAAGADPQRRGSGPCCSTGQRRATSSPTARWDLLGPSLLRTPRPERPEETRRCPRRPVRRRPAASVPRSELR